MADLTDTIKAVVKRDDGDVTFTLRSPSNPEINKYLAKKQMSMVNKMFQDSSVSARIEFFDLLLTGIENLTKNGQPVTPDMLDFIPDNWKNSIILHLFDADEIEIKN